MGRPGRGRAVRHNRLNCYPGRAGCQRVGNRPRISGHEVGLGGAWRWQSAAGPPVEKITRDSTGHRAAAAFARGAAATLLETQLIPPRGKETLMNRRNVIWLIGIDQRGVVDRRLVVVGGGTRAHRHRPFGRGRIAGDARAISRMTWKPRCRRLDVQAAELSLRLYELDLQKIDDINKQMAGLYSNAVVDRFRANVEMAKQRVKAARERAEGKHAVAIVGIGQALLQNAEDTYERDMAANRQLSTAVKPVDVERDRVAVEMAKVNLDKAKLVDQLDSPIAIINWEIDVLRDEVRQLRWRITAITSRR